MQSTTTTPYYQGPALRVANMIATVKVLAVTVLAFIFGAASIIAIVAGFKERDGVLALSGAAALIGGVIALTLIYVVLGWFEHVLRVLVAIANNGRR